MDKRSFLKMNNYECYKSGNPDAKPAIDKIYFVFRFNSKTNKLFIKKL